MVVLALSTLLVVFHYLLIILGLALTIMLLIFACVFIFAFIIAVPSFVSLHLRLLDFHSNAANPRKPADPIRHTDTQTHRHTETLAAGADCCLLLELTVCCWPLLLAAAAGW